MFRRTILVLIALMMLSATALTVSTGTASAYGGDLEYTTVYDWRNDVSSIEITGYNGPGGDVVIPKEIDGLPVTSIAENAFYYIATITSVTIPDCVTTIGYGAFMYCTSLTTATVGNGVTELEGTFSLCFALTNVTIGNNVTDIRANSFMFCSDLRSIALPASVTTVRSYAFSYCFALESMIFEGNAPRMEANWDYLRTVIPEAASLNAYYYHGASGFSLPSWNGLPSVCLPIVPTEPRELMVKSGDENATLTWKAPADDGGATIDHYVIYMNGTELMTVNTTSAVVADLTNEELYTFIVAAHNSVGYGLNSSEELAFPREGLLTTLPPVIGVPETVGSSDVMSGIADNAGSDRAVLMGGFGLIAIVSVVIGLAMARRER